MYNEQIKKEHSVIDIFRNTPDINSGILIPPNWEFIKQGILENVEQVQSYYKTNIRPVKSNHFLVRLLQSLSVSKNMSLERYFENVDTIALNHSMMFRMTSSIYKGIVHRGIFYGGSTPEILIAVDETFDIYETHSNWKNVQAIKVLLHPKSDMNYEIPNGKQHSNEDGLVVISINVSMLAIQYRAFLLDEWLKNKDNPRGTTHFVGAYVLPNMLPTQTELSIFNRTYNLVFDLNSNNDNRQKHPFSIANYKHFLDKALEHTVEYLDRSSKSFRTIFHTVPSVYNKTMYESLLVPDIAGTRQVSWALVISRLKMIDFLIKVAGKELASKNQTQMNQVLKALRINNVYNVFKEILPLDVYFPIEEQVENILNSMGKHNL